MFLHAKSCFYIISSIFTSFFVNFFVACVRRRRCPSSECSFRIFDKPDFMQNFSRFITAVSYMRYHGGLFVSRKAFLACFMSFHGLGLSWEDFISSPTVAFTISSIRDRCRHSALCCTEIPHPPTHTFELHPHPHRHRHPQPPLHRPRLFHRGTGREIFLTFSVIRMARSSGRVRKRENIRFTFLRVSVPS